MAPPKSILKKPTPSSGPKAGPSTGSKLKRSIALPQKRSGQPKSKGKKASRREEADDEDEDMDDKDGEGDSGDEDIGTDEEIERAQSKGGKGKQVKRKRPTTADEFGSALTSLLTEPTKPPAKSRKVEDAIAPAPSKSSPTVPSIDIKPAKIRAQPILSLSRSRLPPTATTEKLERQAARAVKRAKEEKEDRARVRDVVEGWSHEGVEGQVMGGLEFEKGLRKTAQRGVIKLFNAILTASRENAAPDAVASTTLAKSAALSGVKGYGKKDKDNILGRGNKEELTKEGFLELVKKGAAA